MGLTMWRADDAAVVLGTSNEILVCLDDAPSDPSEVTKALESMFTFDEIEFMIDRDDGGALHFWAVLVNGSRRSETGQ